MTNKLETPIKITQQVYNTVTIPLVSIICNTYNHKNFISDAIEGFLIQETTFPVEILIHDDASTDGTTEIVKSYEKKYPDLIKAIYQNKNQRSQGIKPFVKFQHPRAKGKYIALCEGDDYWTAPDKLQKQIDFLEKNRDFSICFHNGQLLENDKICDDPLNIDQPEITTIIDLCKKNFIRTASCVFRNHLFDKLPESYNKSPVGDYFLHLLNAQYGKTKFFSEKMSVYRIHSQGLWSSKTPLQQMVSSTEVYKFLIQHFSGEVQQALLFAYFNLNESIINYYSKDKDRLINEHKSNLNDPYYLIEKCNFSVMLKASALKLIRFIKKHTYLQLRKLI
ncbi:glycosyltransferase [Methylomarinum vadi]|uniref:glycosyltransferase n=1 Tax=Methylomarinum vadi TaxID=438855 RepID=UPI000691DC49|nr:glycosyltransferase [Methylomarinum vadi]